MKIINNTHCTTFHDVGIGCVFQYVNTIFMRTDDNETDCGLMNAVNLENGTAVHFCYDEKVRLLPEAHIVIE